MAIGTSTNQLTYNATILNVSVAIVCRTLCDIGRTCAECNVTVNDDILEYTCLVRNTAYCTTCVSVLAVSDNGLINSYVAIYSTVLNVTYNYTTNESTNVWLRASPVTASYEVSVNVAVDEQTAVVTYECTIILVAVSVVWSQSTRCIDSQVLDNYACIGVSEQRTNRVPVLD